MLKKYIETGQIVGTHGVRGEVRVYPMADSPDFLLGFKRVYLSRRGKPVAVLSSRRHGNVVLLKLDGVADANAAEQLVGKKVFINREDVTLPPGRYFVEDLVGCRALVSGTDKEIGVISEVKCLPANDVWVIKSPGREVLLPAVEEFVGAVCPEEGYVEIKPRKGLLPDED